MYNTPIEVLGGSMRIGFFDSGIGGLTVLAEALRQEPSHQYFYYADSDHAPYGCKPAAEVQDRVLSAAEFLAGYNLDALVIACNTATAVCIQRLRERFPFPVIGMEPAVKPALHHTQGDAPQVVAGQDKRVMVMATSLTLQESKLSQLIRRFDSQGRVDKLAMDQLVVFAEQFSQPGGLDLAAADSYLSQQLRHYSVNDYSAIVLGCTHFIYFKSALQNIVGPGVALVDGNQGTVNHLFRQLKQGPHSRGEAAGVRFFRSGVEQPRACYEPLLELEL